MIRLSGIVLILIYGRIILNRCGIKKKFVYVLAMHIVCTNYITIGNAIQLGGFGLTFSDVSLILLILFSILMSLHQKSVIRDHFLGVDIIVFFTLSIVTWVFVSLFPGDALLVPMGKFWFITAVQPPIFHSSYLAYYIRFVLFYLVLSQCYQAMDYIDIQIIKQIMIFVGKIILCFAIFEFLTKSVNEGLFKRVVDVIFIDTDNYFIRTRGGLAPILGCSFEPSMFVWSNLPFGLILVNEKTKSSKIWFIILLIELLISMSFSSILILSILLFYALIKFEASWKVMILFAAGILLTYILSRNSELLSYYFKRYTQLQTTIAGNQYSTTENYEIRIQSIQYTMSQIWKRPILGFGIGTGYAYSGIVSFLAMSGSVGCLLYYLSLRRFLRRWINLTNGKLVVGLLIVALIFMGSIADFYTFPMVFTVLICGCSNEDLQNME